MAHLACLLWSGALTADGGNHKAVQVAGFGTRPLPPMEMKTEHLQAWYFLSVDIAS